MSDLHERSAPALVGDLVTHVTELVRKEIQLLRAEMNEKSTQVMVAAGTIVAAVAIALTALNVLAAALVAALTNAGIPDTWSAVIVGGILAVVGFALAGKGINSLKASSLAPERTARAASRDATMVKEKL
jgi:phage-related baseplate assembly protein